ncbi:hypothetical protein NKDENANG_02033 [Candidatus Entotheonellaceae bacterium PAL068K]
MVKTKNTENIELVKLTLELPDVLKAFYEEMVDVHTELINDYEKIETMIE